MHLHTGKGVPEMGDIGRGKGKYPFFRVRKIKMLVTDDFFWKAGTVCAIIVPILRVEVTVVQRVTLLPQSLRQTPERMHFVV